MSLNQKAIKAIKHYQDTKNITVGSGRCKHYPSCSNYAIGCYEKFSFLKASFLSLGRIIRCNPLTRKVYDPVPLTKQEKQQQKELINQAQEITPVLIDFYHCYPKAQTIDFIKAIHNYTFQSKELDHRTIQLFHQHLYLFKQLVKQKKIPLNYQEVFKIINDYLNHFKNLEEPIHSSIFQELYQKKDLS